MQKNGNIRAWNRVLAALLAGVVTGLGALSLRVPESYAAEATSSVASVDVASAERVTFTLPECYEYAEVMDTDTEECRVTVPMIGARNAAAVVRFRLTNVAAGTVSFTFPTNVTGTATIDRAAFCDAAISADEQGITAAALANAGKTVTVIGIPETPAGSYIYISLPVPTGTVPGGILVSNEPASGGTMRAKTITGSTEPLALACGFKLAANLT